MPSPKDRFDTAEEALKGLPDWLRNQQVIMSVSVLALNHMQIGKLVRERREATKMSLRCMAKWMSISASYLSDLETGNRQWNPARLRDATAVLEMAERTHK